MSDVPSHRTGPKPNSGDQVAIPRDIEAELGIVNLGTANFDRFSMAAETGSPARTRTNSLLSTESGRGGCHQRLHAAKHKVQSRTEAADRPGNCSWGPTPVLSSASTISTAVGSSPLGSQGHVQPRQQNRLKELAAITDKAHAAERAAPPALLEAEPPQQRTPSRLENLREAEVLEEGPLIPKVVSRELMQPEQQPAALAPLQQPPHGSAATRIPVAPLSLSEQIRELEAQPSFAPRVEPRRTSCGSCASASSFLEPEALFGTPRSTSFQEMDTPRKRFNKMQTPIVHARRSGCSSSG